jgi:hypothetical protein
LRFFHHFLVTAHPPLPLQGDAVWQQMGQLSNEVSFERDIERALFADGIV